MLTPRSLERFAHQRGWSLSCEITQAGLPLNGSPTGIAATDRPKTDGQRVIRITDHSKMQWCVKLMAQDMIGRVNSEERSAHS